jgi:hypothetical protein
MNKPTDIKMVYLLFMHLTLIWMCEIEPNLRFTLKDKKQNKRET